MTDTTLLSLVQRYVLEPTVDGGRSWPTRLWDREEVLAYLHDTQQDFLLRTEVARGWASLPYAPNQATIALDPEILTLLSAETDQAGVVRPCLLASAMEADLVRSRPSPRPLVLVLETPGPNQGELVPPAAQAGTLECLVVPAPQHVRGEGDPLTVGDVWVPFLIQGLLARMFDKPGNAYNPTRAARCRAFYDLGITLAQRRLGPQT